MAVEILFTFLRHGEKDAEGNLTERGRQQVAETTAAHLRDIPIDFVLHSGAQRTIETVQIALQTLGLQYESVPTRYESGFSFDLLTRNPNLPGLEEWSWKEIERRLDGAGQYATPYRWLEAWGPAYFIRALVTETMFRMTREEYIRQTVQDTSSQTPPVHKHILIGSHDPLSVLALPNPKEPIRLGFADVLQYTVTYDGGERPSIAKIKYIACPLR